MSRGAVLRALILVFAAGLLWWSWMGRGQPHAARAAVEQQGAVLVDVRTPAEYAGGHLPGAVNIPSYELGKRLTEIGAKDKPVVVYCRSGSRSDRARRELLAAGFTTVFNLGPMSNW